VNSIEEWVRGHDASLENIARDTELPTSFVRLAAVLVLEGLPDHEIYDLLREQVISLDGQHNPLGGAPLALEQIRLLAAG
jgi:hypothetical protein